MRMYAVADDRDTLTGLRLAGIEGSYANEKHDIQVLIDGVRENADVAVLIITEGCAALVPETVKELKLSSTNPLLVVVPGSHGSSREADSITALIREAIGVKI